MRFVNHRTVMPAVRLKLHNQEHLNNIKEQILEALVRGISAASGWCKVILNRLINL